MLSRHFNMLFTILDGDKSFEETCLHGLNGRGGGMVGVDRSISIEGFMPSGLKMPSVYRDKLQLISLLHSAKSWRWRPHFPMKHCHQCKRCVCSQSRRSVLSNRHCENLKNYERVIWVLRPTIIRVDWRQKTCRCRVPVVVPSKALVGGRFLAEIAGSTCTGSIDVGLLWVLCVVMWRSVVSVVCCYVEVCATIRSFVQGTSTECVCVCVCHWVWSDTTIAPTP